MQPTSYEIPYNYRWTSVGPMAQWHVHSSEYLHGIRLFNRAAFFEAHEALEDVWRASPEPEKKFLQGLIQIAVGLHHYSNGNLIGARSLLGRAASNLARYPENFGGMQLTQLLNCIAEWQQALADNKPVPPFPKLDMEST